MIKRLVIFAATLTLFACEQPTTPPPVPGEAPEEETPPVDPADPPAEENPETPTDPAEPEEETPPAGPGSPLGRLPADWFADPGELTEGGARDQGDFGFIAAGPDGEPLDIAPGIRFPVEEGPAFSNSQIFGKGGNGFGCTNPATCNWPPVPGAQNDETNYNYPWQDNFCEVRDHSTGDCPAGRGHQGQDIRPATCDNGEHWAVAPERVKVRNIGSRVLVNLFGLDSGQLHTMMHLDRPLAINPRTGQPIKTGDIMEPGERIGRISNMTSLNGCPSGRCTSLHLHYEIWDGAAESGGFNDRGVKPLPLYASLVVSYENLLLSEPAGEDWVSARPQPSSSACSAP